MRLISLSDNQTEAENRISRYQDMTDARTRTSLENISIELLQHMFSYLDLIALLRSRCVCARWLEGIPGDSGGLRNILFLPMRTTTKTDTMQSYNLSVTFYTDAKNPHRQWRSPTVGMISQISMISASPGVADSAVSLHPFILKPRYMRAHILPGLIGAPSRSLSFLNLWKKAADRLVHPRDSKLWKQLLVTTPASTEFRITYRYIDRENYPLSPRTGKVQTYCAMLTVSASAKCSMR